MSNVLNCRVCGEGVHSFESCQIIKRDLTTRRTKKLFDVCPKCASKIKNKKFKMPTTRGSIPKLTSIVVKDFGKGKQETIYDVFPKQLEEIEKMAKPLDRLPLKNIDGSRFYTKKQVTDWMDKSRSNTCSAMIWLWGTQTPDEQATRSTKYDNSVGFNKPDADFLTGMCRIYESNNGDVSVYTDRQYEAIQRRLRKYISQITKIINLAKIELKGA